MVWTRGFCLLISLGIAHAHQSGAGACDGGKPVVAGPHLEFGPGSPHSDRHGGSGTLDDGFTSFHLAGVQAESGRTLTVPIGSDIPWTLKADRVPIRGFLLRMEAPNGVETTAAITCGANQALASACVAPIIGCTHVDKSDKFSVDGSFRFDEIAEGVKLDVTVVYQNNMEVNIIDYTVASLYAYSQFTVDFVGDFVGDSDEPSGDSSNPFLAFLAVIRQIIDLIVSIFS